MVPFSVTPAAAHTIATYSMGALLLACAIAQVNDPDPELWLPLYGIPAVLCYVEILHGYGPALRWAWVGMAGVALAVGFVSWPDFASALYSAPTASALFDVEVAREMGGLALLVAWASVRSRKSALGSGSWLQAFAALAVPTVVLAGIVYFVAAGTKCGFKS